MVSLILNSRGRPSLLQKMLESAFSTCSDPSKVLVYVRVDQDDGSTLNFLRNIDVFFHYGTQVQAIVGPRPTNLHREINRMALQAVSNVCGDYLFVLNDDVIFETAGWDTELYNLKLPSDKIAYIRTNDNSVDKEGNKEYSSFPILTKEAYYGLGYLMSNKFVGLGADVYLWRIFNEVGRVFNSNIRLNHTLHSSLSLVMSPDSTATDMRNNTYKNLVNCWNESIKEDVDNLKNFI